MYKVGNVEDAVLSWNEVQKIIIGNKADLPRQVSAEMVRREFGNDNKIRCYEVDTRTPKGIAEIQKAMGYLIDCKVSLICRNR